MKNCTNSSILSTERFANSNCAYLSFSTLFQTDLFPTPPKNAGDGVTTCDDVKWYNDSLHLCQTPKLITIKCSLFPFDSMRSMYDKTSVGTQYNHIF